jgi:nucleoside-diphosphate-sugar epimerase
MAAKPTILITGVSGQVGTRLARELDDFQVIGADIREPARSEDLFRFEKIDLAAERSCDQLLDLMRAYRPEALAHLAFVTDPGPAEGRDARAMWQTNVFGTSRVLEAIAEHNRMSGRIEKFVFTSSALVYGPAPVLQPVTEGAPLQARSLVYAEQQQEADLTVQERIAGLGGCRTYILRSQVHGGPGARNYLLAALHGQPSVRGRLGRLFERRAARLPLFLPNRGDHLDHRFQFVHVDDGARLVAHIVRRPQLDSRLTILNVAGRGDAVPLRRCLQIAGAGVKHLPGKDLCRRAMRMLWDWGVSDISPRVQDYLLGSCILETAKLRSFLGEDYRSVIQHTCEEALMESFKPLSSRDVQPMLQSAG